MDVQDIGGKVSVFQLLCNMRYSLMQIILHIMKPDILEFINHMFWNKYYQVSLPIITLIIYWYIYLAFPFIHFCLEH